MKNKILTHIILMAGLLTVVSCDDFLEQAPLSSFDQAYIFSNTDDMKRALLGAYAPFTEDSYTSRMSNVWMQNTDVEVSAPSASPDGSRRDIWSLQGGLLTGFNDVYRAWQDNFLVIDRANQCIEGIQASAVANEPDAKMMLGEAYCLRAYRYFLLCNFWGDVPYFRESAKEGIELDRPKTDKNIIYSGLIQDLVDAEENMYFSDEFSDGIERMNRDFALGFIARLALFRAGYGMTKEGVMKRADDYADISDNAELAVTYTYNGQTKTARTSQEYYRLAKDYCEKLISLRPRELVSDFAKIFRDECEFIKTPNSEVLFEVAFGDSNSGGDVGWCVGQIVNSSYKGSTTIQLGLCPSYYYSFDHRDSRRTVTCALTRYASDDEKFIPGSIRELATNKWSRLLLTTDPGSASSKSTGINWPLMRYSDILLMLAEAENELNGPTATAKEALAKVRRRAFPAQYHGEAVNDYLNRLGSKQDFFEAVVNERAWEFGGECMRKFDLVRWNNYGKKIIETKNTIDLMGQAALGINLDNPEVAQYASLSDILYYQKPPGGLFILNDYYKPDNVPALTTDAANLGKPGYEDYYATTNWTKDLYKKVDGTNGAPATYESADYTVRCWRGYKDPTGQSAVPYLLPIDVTTLGASKVLTNDGYGHVFSAN
jgi:hypothetical protein